MVAITGCRGRVDLGGIGVQQADDVPSEFDHHALQPQTQTQGGNPVLTGVPQGAELPLDTAHPETARNTDTVDVREGRSCPVRGSAVVRGNPPQVNPAVVGEAAGPEGLGHRQVGVGQVDVLADQRQCHLVGGR
jgi:hypothetical protein